MWLIDPVDGEGLDELLAPHGEVAGVLQLVDRHPRDCAALAERHGVPHLRLPFDGIPGTPFTVVPVVDRRGWREVALWWPRERILVVTESLGAARYFLPRGRRVGIHPLIRLRPPHVLGAHDPVRLLLGHGEPLQGPDLGDEVRAALDASRRDIPRMALGALRRSG